MSRLIFHRTKEPRKGYIAIDGDYAYLIYLEDDGTRDHGNRSAWVAEFQDNDPISNETDEAAPWTPINYSSTKAGIVEICQEHRSKRQ